MMKISQVESSNHDYVVAYLKEHEETSQFLIGNLRAHGPKLTEHQNSGNFKALYNDREVIGVFCLTRRGNLLIQVSAEASELILRSCEGEPIPLKGFIGDWQSVEPIFKEYRHNNKTFNPSYLSKEILYRYVLDNNDLNLKSDQRVWQLVPGDYEKWLPLNLAYMEELKLPEDISSEQRKRDFQIRTSEGILWGMFIDGALVTIAGLNSCGETIGQVGGVYTPPQFRRRGHSKSTMFHMLKDCRDKLGHKKNILFTGETDIPAQKLYESMGYEAIGSFALVLGG